MTRNTQNYNEHRRISPGLIRIDYLAGAVTKSKTILPPRRPLSFDRWDDLGGWIAFIENQDRFHLN